MSKMLLMGNQAIAMGALRAGVGLVSGYPGTPSTEIIETISKNNPGDVHVEWSVNEKSAMEVAAGAAYAGVRSMVTMKQVGLNVASDPLMSLAYVGIKGGMVIVCADDPGPISSQTEQDTRTFAGFAKLPVFDPSSPEEAYEMIGEAFECSERNGRPVILRPTTRVCHGCSVVDVGEREVTPAKGCFEKSPKWVIFPQASYQNHIRLEELRERLSSEFSAYKRNYIEGSGKVGIAVGGVALGYVKEALKLLGDPQCKLMRIATPYPFPEDIALDFLDGLDEVLVLEELDPVIERELLRLCGKHKLPAVIKGKLTHNASVAGELSTQLCVNAIKGFMGLDNEQTRAACENTFDPADFPQMAKRPPVLCAGCPHRASFYAVKRALSGQKAVFSGDIGCYTLGNAAPLDMVDTCLCMGAGVTIAQGLHAVEPDAKNLAFIGDSTFYHTGIPGVINALYNKHDITIIVLDNSTTAMTGHQPHPGTGKTVMGLDTFAQCIPDVLKGLGVNDVFVCDPLDLDNAIETVQKAVAVEGVSVVVFRSPCIALYKPERAMTVDSEKCVGCNMCMEQLGCPAISRGESCAVISPSMCTGCGLCSQVCPCDAIGGKQND